jgi:hypothetical protein
MSHQAQQIGTKKSVFTRPCSFVTWLGIPPSLVILQFNTPSNRTTCHQCGKEKEAADVVMCNIGLFSHDHHHFLLPLPHAQEGVVALF